MNPGERARLRRAHARAAEHFADTAFLHAELRGRLAERLDWIGLTPDRVIDLGCGPGAALPLLRARFPRAQLLAIDHAQAMLAAAAGPAAATGADRLCAAAERLPLADGAAALVFANLSLAYCPDPVPVLAECRRCLASPGALALATLGRGALAELRDAWAAADGHAHVAPFIDMHDLGDLLVHAGFAEPVLDTEVLTVHYATIDRLIDDLRAAGALNFAVQRNPGLTGRRAAGRFRAALEARRGADGRIPITVEVVQALAWAGPARTGGRRDEFEVPVDRLAGVRRRGG